MLNIFEFEFMRLAFIGGTLLAVLAPLIGQFMVYRGYSGISDGVSHIALLGLSLGIILDTAPVFVAILATIVLSLALEYLRSQNILRAETGIVLFVIFSLSSITILNQVFRIQRSLESLLFGSILSLRIVDIYWLLAVLIISSVFVVLNYKSLLNLLFEEDVAKLYRVNVKFLNYFLISLVAAIVVVGIDITGGLLMASLMILPVVSSQQFNLGFRDSGLISIVLAIISVWVGLILAWYLETPPGASIGIVSVLIFLYSMLQNKFLKKFF